MRQFGSVRVQHVNGIYQSATKSFTAPVCLRSAQVDSPLSLASCHPISAGLNVRVFRREGVSPAENRRVYRAYASLLRRPAAPTRRFSAGNNSTGTMPPLLTGIFGCRFAFTFE
jgi:hypothetical protein